MFEVLAAPAFVFGAGLWGVYQTHRNFRRNGEKVAAACGLTVEETSNFWSSQMVFKARAGPLQVILQGLTRRPHHRHKRSHQALLQVIAPSPPEFASLRILAEADKPPKAREVEIGDPAFDSAFYTAGPEWLLLALLDAETRQRLLTANEDNTLEIINGVLQVNVSFRKMPAVLENLCALARRFMQPLDILRNLAENARRDPDAEVRLRNLRALVREYPGQPQTREALHVAGVDPNPFIRLRAAHELGEEGYEVFLQLAESPENDVVSARAVALLGRGLSLPRVRAILQQALRLRLLETARACLEALGLGGDPEDVGTLANVLADEKEELAADAAQALGAIGDPAAEPPLLRTLGGARADVRLAAAKALGRAGTAAAVLPLQEAAGRRDHDVRRAARQSIAEIQSRLQGASPGQLSLAEEGGKLSLAENDPAGRLALADEKDGRG